ncbi:MAG: Lrp/AsnC family transcriptional regulator [Candidatus Bathyarchaeota archaeon]|nr:MAG: Lrp/AsnC family transcriptional regulator [Candidatus Bathyarchaeota archaeon]
MKQTEFKLFCELMKNSRRSDRELAKILRVSQPTVTRARRKLEKEGYIKEYTMLPDFGKLGFELMALTFIKYKEGITEKEMEEVTEVARRYEKENPKAVLMAVTGRGLGYERVIITFHKNYSSFAESIALIRQFPHRAVADIDSFLVPLSETHYLPCTFSAIADYLLTQK